MYIKKFLSSVLAFTFLTFSVVPSAYANNPWWGGGGYQGKNKASNVSVDTTNFSGNLSSSDINVQTALETLDALTAGVSGPGSSTDNAIVRWNGAGGTAIQNSAVIIDDSDNVSGVTTLTIDGTTSSFGSGSADFTQTYDVDATNDVTVAYGESGSANSVTVTGAAINYTITTPNGSNQQSALVMGSDRSSGNFNTGAINLNGKDSGSANQTYGTFRGDIVTNTASSENGGVSIGFVRGGTLNLDEVTFRTSGYLFNQDNNDTDYKFGTTSGDNTLVIDSGGDFVSVGSVVDLGAQFQVVGLRDEIQMLVQPNGTQTQQLAVWLNTSSQFQHVFEGDGDVVFNEPGIATNLRAEGDNEVDLLHVDGVNDTVGVGIDPNTLGRFVVDQDSATGAKPVLYLDQADIDVVLMSVIGSSEDSTADRTLVDAADMTTPGSIVGWIQVHIQDDQSTNPITDGDYYIPFYAAPSA